MKSLINIVLSVFVAMLFLFYFGIFENLKLFFLILLIFILIINNVSEYKYPFLYKNKKIIFLVIGLLILIYIFIPKKITSCGNLGKEISCSTISCIGIPYNIGIATSPKCVGKVLKSWHFTE